MIKKSRHGFALVGAILAMIVLGIIIPLFVTLVQKDTRDSVATTKKTTALQLAEAGQDRGAWKLRESDDIWDDAVGGVAPAGYDDSQTFDDVEGGEYRIDISAGPGVGQVTVISKGRANGSADIRAIQAVYAKGTTVGALSVNGALQYKPNLSIEWGPVVTFTSITQSPSNYYPRKYSAGQIVGRDTTNDSNNGALPSGRWDLYDYVAFYDMGVAPTVDLAYYLDKAKNSYVPPLKKGSGSGSASPWTAGGFTSGYYPKLAQGGSTGNSNGVKVEKGSGGGNYSFTCSTCVIYIDGDVRRYPSGTWLDVEALVVTEDADFNGGGHAYTATIPANAQDEYQYSTAGVNYWNSKGWTNGGTATVTDCGFRGFMYVGGDVGNAGGGSTMVGAIYVVGNVSTNTMKVYYDSSIATNVEFENAAINRVSWDEVRNVAW